MASVQMNVRIPEDIKREGDIGIKNAGYTPSEVCNMIWDFCARHNHNKEKIHNTLKSFEQKRKISYKLDKNFVVREFKKLGLDPYEFGKDIPEGSNDALHDYIAEARIADMNERCK